MNNLTYDKTKDGWFLVKNVQRRLTSCDIEGVSYLRKYGAGSHGNDVLDRAIELDADYGQADAEYLLEHQDKIPEELRPYRLIFTGTIWRGPNSRYIPCLEWSWWGESGKQWGIRFTSWFSETRWNSNLERLIRICEGKDDPSEYTRNYSPPTFRSLWNSDCDLW